jgi:metal transporter CNNM
MSAFVKIIPQSVCSRYGLAIGASVTPFVRVLVWLCYPVAFPISKVIHIEHTLYYFL